MKSLIRNKKGDVTDMLLFVIAVFILFVGFFILAFIVPQITDGLKDAGLNNSAEGANAIDRLSEFGTVTIQRGVFFLFVGLIISTMVTAFFARTHPIFLFLYILILGISIILSVYLGNAYQTMTETEIFAETLVSQTLLNIVMSNIITIVLAVGALSMIIVFAKFTTGGGQRI